MINKEMLCSKIKELYPTIGECGIDIRAEYDHAEKTWLVHLNKDNQHLKTYLEDGDAENCMQGELCVGLGIEIAQLKANIERMSDVQPSQKDPVCTKAPEMAEHQRLMDDEEPCDNGRSGRI